MQLAARGPATPPPTEVAALLRSGTAWLGHRPAVTVLHPGARYEQSGTSLANWAAKGAHVLELDHLVGPETVVALDAPACWTTATVALATWWLGGTVRVPDPAAGVPDPATGVGDPALAGPDEPGTAVTVRHEGRLAGGNHGPDGPILVVGDALDGGPTGPVAHPVWNHEAQPMPDAAPQHAAAPDRIAVVRGDEKWTQRELLALAGTLGDGVLGVEVERVDPVVALAASALRPFLTGQATVLLRGVDRDAATPERVSAWCGSSAG